MAVHGDGGEESEHNTMENAVSDESTDRPNLGDAGSPVDLTTTENVPRSHYEELLGRLGALEKKITKLDNSAQTGDLDSDDDQYPNDLFGPWLDDKSLRDIRFMIRSARSVRASYKAQAAANKAAEQAAVAGGRSHLKTEGDQGLSAAQLLQEGIKVAPDYSHWRKFDNKTDVHISSISLLEPIHVLIGEPNIDQTMHLSGQMPSEGLDGDRPSIESLNSRLPERIHIHSFLLMRRLERVFGRNPDFSANGVVFLRPFKSLAYFEQDLRSNQSNLRESISTRIQEGIPITPWKKAAPEFPLPAGRSADDIEHFSLLRDSAILLQLDCLLEFFDSNIKPRLHGFKDNNYHEEIAFDELWNLFKPGDLVLEQGEKQAYRVIQVITPAHRGSSPWARWFKDDTSDSRSDFDDESDGDPLRLECVFLDYDGVQFGPVSKSFKVPRYEGKRPIKSLPVYGLRFSPSPNIQEQLIERGKLLIDVAVYKSMYYTGFSLDTGEEIDSQVVADFAEALSVAENASWRPKISPASTGNNRKNRPPCMQSCCAGRLVYNDDFVDRKLVEAFMQTLMPQQTDKPPLTIHPKAWAEMEKEGHTPSDDELLIMTYRVFAFVLRSRKWVMLLIINFKKKKKSIVRY
jgi:hypothetical protein